jgi:hypothetical protein
MSLLAASSTYQSSSEMRKTLSNLDRSGGHNPSKCVWLQVVRRCAEAEQLAGSQTEYDHPDWLANARVPVLLGGYIGFILAYFLSLYTIFHVAKAYKKLELKVCPAQIAFPRTWLPC